MNMNIQVITNAVSLAVSPAIKRLPWKGQAYWANQAAKEAAAAYTRLLQDQGVSEDNLEYAHTLVRELYLLRASLVVEMEREALPTAKSEGEAICYNMLYRIAQSLYKAQAEKKILFLDPTRSSLKTLDNLNDEIIECQEQARTLIERRGLTNTFKYLFV